MYEYFARDGLAECEDGGSEARIRTGGTWNLEHCSSMDGGSRCGSDERSEVGMSLVGRNT